MFRSQFKTRDKYLAYIYAWEYMAGPDYHHALEPVQCYTHWKTGCTESFPCSEHPTTDHSEFGIIYTRFKGRQNASHCSAPMFSLKAGVDGHAWFEGVEDGCDWCEPEKYYHGDEDAGLDLSEYIWQSLRWARKCAAMGHFIELNEECGLVNEHGPDFTLSERVSHP